MYNMKLINSDCLDALEKIPDGSVDCIITDPPYPVISGGQTETAKKFYRGGWKNDGKIFKENNFNFDVDFLNLLYFKLADQAHIYWFSNFLNLTRFLNLFDDSLFHVHNLLIWKKRSVVNRWYLKNCEYVIFARKGKAKSINNKGSETVHYFEVPQKKVHPTEKPIDLLEFYINNSSDPGGVILDPFMGSGTTGVAAKNTGREFIGIEKDPEYFKIAEARINEKI